MSNWKNVNNWHWVNKNCINWAQKWVPEQMVGLEAEKDGNKVSITKMVDLSGDVDLNQRKGKIITIYDIELKFNWQGTLADGTEVTGSIKIPEVAHDTDPDDFVFELSINDDNNAKQAIKPLIRKGLQPLIIKKFEQFSSSMIKDNCEDVYIESHKMGVATPPRLSSPAPQAAANTITNKTAAPATSNTPKVVNTVTLNELEEFQTSAHELFLTLTDAQRASAWTRSQVKLIPEAGKPFELFNGNVSGEILEIIPDQKIVQTWRLRSWPAGHFSRVTMEFNQGSESVQLKVTQTGVPIGEEELTRNNWNGYYWKSIKATFGYGANF